MPRRAGAFAQGRIDNGPPVAVIDIGSNSVRLVVYEGLTRSLTPIFNEKVLAGLGREVLSTGLLAEDAVDKALAALVRFRALCPGDAGRQAVRDRHRRLPRCQQRARIHRPRREGHRGADHHRLGQARGGALRARGRLGIPQARWPRRRPRRRLARTRRRARGANQVRSDAAARRPRAAGPVREVDRRRRRRSPGRRSPGSSFSSTAAAATSMRSAAPGGR